MIFVFACEDIVDLYPDRPLGVLYLFRTQYQPEGLEHCLAALLPSLDVVFSRKTLTFFYHSI